MLNPTAEHEHTDSIRTIVERAQRSMVYNLTETARRLHPTGQVTTLFLQCGGAGIFVPDSSDFRLNFAFSTCSGLFEHDIRVLENAYVFCDRPVTIFIPISAPNATFDRLKARGFSARGGSNNVLFRSLDDIEMTQPVQFESATVVDDMIIAPATPDEFDAFVEYHSRGDNGAPSESLKRTAEITTWIPNTTIFLARLDGRIIAATSVTALEVGSGEVAAYTGLTSTLAECRGRGVSTALKRCVHTWAKERGYRWVFAHVESDNSNTRVLEKLGYRSLFPHAVYATHSGSESCSRT